MQSLGSGPRLPDEPWPLTAPESYVLRYGLGNNAHGLHAFKLALTELVARRALDLRGAWVRRRWAPGRYPTFLLCDGPHKGAVEEPSLRPVVELHTNARTPASIRAFEQLDAWMEVTRRGLFGWSHDEAWLRAFVAGAGASVFLTQFATPGQPVLKHIGSALASFPSHDMSNTAAYWDSGGLDFAGLAGSLDGAFDVFGAAFIDAGVGGGGGDGGGGGG